MYVCVCTNTYTYHILKSGKMMHDIYMYDICICMYVCMYIYIYICVCAEGQEFKAAHECS